MRDLTAEVHLLVQDATLTGGHEGAASKEKKELQLSGDANDRFLDGPACRRIAIVDFDPATGLPLPPPATFTPLTSNPRYGRYVADGNETSAASIAINAFGTVFQTVRMFEGDGALGRQVEWAFGSEQLLIVPRAGEWANAFYERATRSLQFFSFVPESGKRVYTALSRDVVAHECGHALLDAVVPSLYDSSTPQSVAIHEAVADLIAVIMALDSGRLRQAVLTAGDNSLGTSNAFTAIAEEFGMARPGEDGVARTALRELKNEETLETLAGARPHILSTLLSGIFYDTLSAIFDTLFEGATRPNADGETPTPTAAANKALGTTQIVFRRFLLRGLDYLPPGELSFADVGRATLAADRAARPDDGDLRREFAEQFVRRLVVPSVAELDSPRPPELSLAVDETESLRGSDWAAYQYVTEHRSTLGIPEGLAFTVLARVDSTKRIGAKDKRQRELIVKISWNDTEPVAGTSGRMRVVPTGATVVLDWASGTCLALLRSDVGGDVHRQERDRLLSELEDGGILDADDDAGVGLRGDGDSGLRASHRLLHLAGWDA